MELDIMELHQDLEDLKTERAAVERERLELQCKLDELDKTLHRVVKLQAIYEHCLSTLIGTDVGNKPDMSFLVEPPRPAIHRSHGKAGPRGMKPGTIKHDCYVVLQEQQAFLFPREISEYLTAKGRQFNYPRPAEMVASVLRSSIVRQQGIFVKNQEGKYGLVTWSPEQIGTQHSNDNGLTLANGSGTMGSNIPHDAMQFSYVHPEPVSQGIDSSVSFFE
jgi:hypothetical protein